MNETTLLRQQVLAALDPLVAPLGFRRPRRGLAWRRKVSPELMHSLHLNFGLYPAAGQVIINPSIGARHGAVERYLVEAELVSAEIGSDRATFGMQLSELSTHEYDARIQDGSGPVVEKVWADWQEFGEPCLERLSDLDSVIHMLQSEAPRQWPCASRSDRARLLPLTLAAAGRCEEALAWLDHLRVDVEGRDQYVVPFTRFEEWFRRTFVA